jgi:hypothetical protein
LAEQLTLNQWVPGSSPGGCTIEKPGISQQYEHPGFSLSRVQKGDPLQNASLAGWCQSVMWPAD